MPELNDKRRILNPKSSDHHSQIYVECPVCHEKRWSRYYGEKKDRYPYIKCWKCITSSGKNHGIWKGGRHYIRGYYRLILSEDDSYFPMADKNKYLFEHRYIMAKHLGRCLKPWELVHHKNGIKSDNRIENLEIVNHLQNISASVFDINNALSILSKQDERIKQLEARVTLLEAENIILKTSNVDPFLFGGKR